MDVISPVVRTAANHCQSHKNPISNFCEARTDKFASLHILKHSCIHTLTHTYMHRPPT